MFNLRIIRIYYLYIINIKFKFNNFNIIIINIVLNSKTFITSIKIFFLNIYRFKKRIIFIKHLFNNKILKIN